MNNPSTGFSKPIHGLEIGIYFLTFLSLCVSSRVAALGLASGILLVLLLFCLYRVLCPKNYGQNGPGRRHRGDLPCDDYGYSPPETEIVPLVLRGHLMVGPGRNKHKKERILEHDIPAAPPGTCYL